MRRAMIAGLVYFAWVFAVAFVVGVVRVLFVAPRLGATVAVLLELPIILAVSWWACGALVTRMAIDAGARERLSMGLIAFVVLQTTEALLAIAAFSQSPAQYVGGFSTLAGQLGLAGQIAFALIPLVRRRG